MGTQISTVYGPIQTPPYEASQKLLEFMKREFSGYLDPYYARLHFNASKQRFELLGETRLKDEAQVMAEIRREGKGVFFCEVDLEFAPSTVDIAVFSGPGDADGTTAVLTFEKELTDYLFTSEVTATPFALALERIARSIGADCFVAGAEYVRWLPLPPRLLTEPQALGESPQVVAWRRGIVDAQAVLAALRARPEWLERTLHGFEFVSMTGRYQQRLPPAPEG